MADCTAPPCDIATRPADPEGECDPARLRALVQDNHELVWRLLRRLGVGVPWIEDAGQQVFLIAASRIADIAPGMERSWVVGTVIRVAANARRSAKRRSKETDAALDSRVDPDPGPDDLMDEKRARACLDHALESMPDGVRIVFVLFELESMTGVEIASLLDLPAGTVASRLRRARELFRKAIDEFGFGVGGLP